MNYRQGIVFSFLAATISGISIFYNKLILNSGYDPMTLNIIKNTFAGILISIYSFNQLKKIPRLSWKRKLTLLAISLIGGSIPFILFFEGLKILPAASANLIHKSLFIWVALMAVPILREKIKIPVLLGYLLIIYSSIVLNWAPSLKTGIGELLVFSATLLWAAENIIARKILAYSDFRLIAWSRMFVGSLILLIFALIQNKIGAIAGLGMQKIIPVLGSGVLLSFYVMSYFKALSKANSTIVTPILIMATPVTVLLDAIFISHSIPVTNLSNAVISILGIVLILKFTKQKTVDAKIPS